MVKTENKSVRMGYYGTSLHNAGHYFWELQGNGFIGYGTNNFNDFPFNPESMVEPEGGYYLRFGTVRYYYIGGYSICAVCGSCSDDRPGTKSVFFMRGEFSRGQMEAIIKDCPIAMEIIEKMPFVVKWDEAKVVP